MEGNMNEKIFKLYFGKEFSNHSTIEAAMEEAKKYIPGEAYLRIESIAGNEAGEWWAYEHENERWARS